MSVNTCKLPATGKVESAVKLVNGKAAEVGRVYLVRSVTVAEGNGSSWVFCSPDEGRVQCSITKPQITLEKEIL